MPNGMDHPHAPKRLNTKGGSKNFPLVYGKPDTPVRPPLVAPGATPAEFLQAQAQRMADRERRAEARAISPVIMRGVSSKMPRLYVRRPHEDLKPGCSVGATYEFRMEPPKDALGAEQQRKPQLPPPRVVKHTVAQLLHDRPALRAVALAKGMTQEDIDEMVASYAKASRWQEPQAKPEAYRAKCPVEPSKPKAADAPKQPEPRWFTWPERRPMFA